MGRIRKMDGNYLDGVSEELILVQRKAELIMHRHDPDADLIPGFGLRVSWAEAELALAIKLLSERVAELEKRLL